MENLKQYDLQAKVGRGGHLYTKEIESPTGRYYLVDEVKAREEARKRKLTVEELQSQFEKLFCGKFSKHENGNYILGATRTAWEAYLFCAMNNNLLKECE